MAMHRREKLFAKRDQNHIPVTTPSPFQPRSFGIQPKSEQSSSLKEEIDARSDRANPYSINLLNIPIHAPGTEPPPPIQTKLSIGQPGDKYEQEADSVAAQVVNQINSPFDRTDKQAANQQTDKAAAETNAPESIQRQGHQNSLTVSQTGGEVLQRAYDLCLESDVTHVEDHRAKKVHVENIKGMPLGAAANSPRVNPFGWAELNSAGHTLANTGSNNSHYNAVRMHLWNGRLGGPGDETWNLAPGPAKVNSMMSAGPETSAKNLVEAGYKVWLTTEVSYLNNSNNANDFTSVVPNRIDMSWGVMGNGASGTWGTDIELPVAPLQGQAAQEYKDWPQNKAPDLVNKLNQTGITNQIRAQAFDLVQHNELKWAIIQKFPQIYLGMQNNTKGVIIKAMPDAVLDDFMKNGLNAITSPERLVDEIIFPLIAVSENIKAQTLFSTLLDKTQQRQAIIAYKLELLQHLGAIAESFAKTDWTIFNYYPAPTKANLLSQMEQNDQINKFLKDLTTKTDSNGLFDLWAHQAGQGNTPQQKLNFINSKTNLGDFYKEQYEDKIKLEGIAIEYLRNRPTRSNGAKKGFKLRNQDIHKNSDGLKKRVPRKVKIKSKRK